MYFVVWRLFQAAKDEIKLKVFQDKGEVKIYEIRYRGITQCGKKYVV